MRHIGQKPQEQTWSDRAEGKDKKQLRHQRTGFPKSGNRRQAKIRKVGAIIVEAINLNQQIYKLQDIH